MNLIVQALFIGPTALVALLVLSNFNKVNVKASRWFGSFLFGIFIIQMQALFYDEQLTATQHHIHDLLDVITYIIAPVFYFSVIHYVEPNRKWKLRDNVHFLFGFVLLLLTVLSFFVPDYHAETMEEKELERKAVFIFSTILSLQVLPYCIAAFYRIERYQRNLLSYASNTETVNLDWLKKVVVCVFVITILWLADLLFQLSEGSTIADIGTTIFYFLGIWYIAYHSLSQKELFSFSKEEKQEIAIILTEVETSTETKKKLIPDDKLPAYIQSLQDFMDSKKPHLDAEISLIRMAEQFNTSPHQLSYIINTGFEENFFQFVNRYRVEEAKRLILDPAMNHLTLVGIAHEAGFNSKTVFNTTFKKITGKTPTQFKNERN